MESGLAKKENRARMKSHGSIKHEKSSATSGNLSTSKKLKGKGKRANKTAQDGMNKAQSYDSGIDTTILSNGSSQHTRGGKSMALYLEKKELPQPGSMQSLLNQFKNIEADGLLIKENEYKPSGLGSKAFTLPRKMPSKETKSDFNPKIPQVKEEPAKLDQNEPCRDYRKPLSPDDEMPEEGLTRNRIALFKNWSKSTPDCAEICTESEDSLISSEQSSTINEYPAIGTTRSLLAVFSKSADNLDDSEAMKEVKATSSPSNNKINTTNTKAKQRTSTNGADKVITDHEEADIQEQDEAVVSLKKLDADRKILPGMRSSLSREVLAELEDVINKKTSATDSELSTEDGDETAQSEETNEALEEKDETTVNDEVNQDTPDDDTLNLTMSEGERPELGSDGDINEKYELSDDPAKPKPSKNMPSALEMFKRLETTKPKSKTHVPSMAAQKSTPTPAGSRK